VNWKNNIFMRISKKKLAITNRGIFKEEGMRKSFLLITILCLLFLGLGCQSAAGEDCEDQATQTCICPGGLISIQTCVGGTWGECDCEGVGGDSDSDSDADMGSVPQVVVGATPASGIAPLDVDFHANVANGDGALTYAWDFGDGDTATGSVPDESHTFAAGGLYNVILVVTDEDGDQGMGTVEIQVSDDLDLGVEITATPEVGEAPLSVSLKATPIGGNPPFTYEWDFNGDGNVDATISNPVTVFEEEGLHEITVTVTDAADKDAEDAANIYVILPNQVPEVSAEVVYGECIPRPNDENFPVQLDGSQSLDTDGQITYEWRFVTVPMPEMGDDDDDNGDINELHFEPSALIANPRFIPPINGEYKVQLFVSDGEHTVGSEILTIEVSDEPAAIEVLSGGGQTAQVDNWYDDPMVALVTNFCGAPIPDEMVRFHGYNVWYGEGYRAGDYQYTDENGEVAFWAWSGIKAGAAQMRASTQCLTATWDLQVEAGEPYMFIMDGFTDNPPVTDDVGSGGVLNFEVTDQYLNPVPAKVQFGLHLDGMYGPDDGPCENDWEDLVWRYCFAKVIDDLPDSYEGNPFDDDELDCTELRNLLTDDNGKASIEVLSLVDRGLRVYFHSDARVIEGDGIGKTLETYAREKWTEDFEGDTSAWEPRDEWTQWEIGSPSGGVGPATCHGGDNCLATNLDGDYLTQQDIFGESSGEEIKDAITNRIRMRNGGNRLVAVDYWQWYDTQGSTCPDCAAALGMVREDGENWYPQGDYPGPGICDENGDPRDKWGYSGNTDGEWQQAFFWEDDSYNERLDLRFEFSTTTYGEADGAGWYVDDIELTALYQREWEFGQVGAADIQFATGPAAYTDSWEERSGYPILDEPDGGIEDCNELGENAIVGTCVYDEFGNHIHEAGVAVDYTIVDKDTAIPTRTEGSAKFVEVLQGKLNSGAGATTAEAETSEDGVIFISLSDTESEIVAVESSADGLTDTYSTDVYFYETESFPDGDCCDNPIDLGVLSSDDSLYYYTRWDFDDMCELHAMGQLLECGYGGYPDIVFTFQVEQDDLYLIEHGNYGGYSTIAELREISGGCPGTPIANEGHPDLGNCIEDDHNDDGNMWVYLYKDKIYILIAQVDEPDDPCHHIHLRISSSSEAR
jgi:PKD repeat protein